MKMLDEFKSFIARGNVVDLAVGIVVGAAFTAIVNSLVSDIVNPVIGLAIGGLDFSEYYVNLDPANHFDSLDAAVKAGAPVLKIGLFINAVVKFLIVAFVVFLLVRQINRLQAGTGLKGKDAPPPAGGYPAPARDPRRAGQQEEVATATRSPGSGP
ncbi:MAG: large conductance mechanosensitive channel protein MscL [Alphaproteobacteria bacterium]